MDTNYTLENVTVYGTTQKRDYSKLPKVKYFRVQSRGIIGSMAHRHERLAGAWAVLVACEDNKGLRLVSDLGYENGMVIKGEFKTKELAFAAAMEYKEKFGMATSKSGKKAQKKIDEAVEKAKEDMVKSLMKSANFSEEMARKALGL